MWLINTRTSTLEHFMSCPVGKYAVLSHTWGSEELDFDLYRSGGASSREGYRKIVFCCDQAREDGYNYAWVDTVCIDKRSSTELSEAINSMFAWYRDAAVCYAYLQDLSSTDIDALGHSRWFSRGWTLQELLAPTKVIFFTRDWEVIGTRDELSGRLQLITAIDESVLSNKTALSDCSVAARMSWAARRATTRIEDAAYCLLGIFDINMPLLYGEGSKAFLRLQEAIVGMTDDESIFAWTGVSKHGSSLFADSPAYFAGAADIVMCADDGDTSRWSSQSLLTNRGLEIERLLLPIRMNTYASPLKCKRRGSSWTTELLTIFIGRTVADHQYRRVMVDGIDLRSFEGWNARHTSRRKLCFKHRDFTTLAPSGGMPSIKFMCNLPEIDLSNRPSATESSDGSPRLAMNDFSHGTLCLDEDDPSNFSLRVGFNSDFEPVFVLHYRSATRWILPPSLSSKSPELVRWRQDFTSLQEYDLCEGADVTCRSSGLCDSMRSTAISLRREDDLLTGGSTWCHRGDRRRGIDVIIPLPSRMNQITGPHPQCRFRGTKRAVRLSMYRPLHADEGGHGMPEVLSRPGNRLRDQDQTLSWHVSLSEFWNVRTNDDRQMNSILMASRPLREQTLISFGLLICGNYAASSVIVGTIMGFVAYDKHGWQVSAWLATYIALVLWFGSIASYWERWNTLSKGTFEGEFARDNRSWGRSQNIDSV